MAGFERLLAWRVAHQLAVELDRVTRSARFRGAYPLADQLRRASLSVVSNIAEGHGRARRAEFAGFLLIARGSGVEIQAQLVLALTTGRLVYNEYARLRGMADHTVALVTKLHSVVLTQCEAGP
jgi:four helix bundle protein